MTSFLEVREDIRNPDRAYAEMLIAFGEEPALQDWCDQIQEGGQTRSVLELGAGSGNLSVPLARRGFTVHAVDADPHLCSFMCAARLPTLSVSCCLFELLSLGRSFDCVILRSGLLNLVSREHGERYLKTAWRHMDQQSRFFIELWRPDWLIRQESMGNEEQSIINRGQNARGHWVIDAQYYVAGTHYKQQHVVRSISLQDLTDMCSLVDLQIVGPPFAINPLNELVCVSRSCVVTKGDLA